MAVFLADCDRMVDIVHHQNPAEKILYQFTVFCICLDQCVRRSDHSRFLQRISLCKAASSADIRQWKEGRTAITVLLQETYHPLRRLFIVRYDILDASAKCCLDRNFVILLHMDNICDNAPDTRFFCLLFHDPPDTVAIAVITLCDIPQGFQTGCLSVVGGLSCLYLPALFLQFRLKFLYFST